MVSFNPYTEKSYKNHTVVKGYIEEVEWTSFYESHRYHYMVEVEYHLVQLSGCGDVGSSLNYSHSSLAVIWTWTSDLTPVEYFSALAKM